MLREGRRAEEAEMLRSWRVEGRDATSCRPVCILPDKAEHEERAWGLILSLFREGTVDGVCWSYVTGPEARFNCA